MTEFALPEHLDGSEIAVVGMACRFPGAAGVDEFWRNLRDGVESITFFTDEELIAAGVDPAELSDPNYVKAAPIIQDVELFDAAFFGYTPREAEVMDPQQRLFLECAWQALENAGHSPETFEGAIGVFAGAKMSTYLLNLVANPELLKSLDVFELAIGNDLSNLATRLSYKLNLKGPSYAFHTACSTSLVAVHLARQSLLIDECQMALAGGVALDVPYKRGYLYQPGGILSPDGHCRAFDAKAQGTVFGSGVGVVVLKRLEDALADGDRVYALLRGSATNNDGAQKASFTAPGVEGQADVILEALADAGVDAATLSYVEAHGTGTALGDPIEILALTEAFRASSEENGFCAVGSVKSNVGHLDVAAGVSSLIKTILALQHQLIPPSLHFEKPNPKIDFENSPFYVNASLTEWGAGATPRRAGVSSFGFGSTNAHVVLEEAPALVPSGPSRPWQLLSLSARTDTALETATAHLAEHLRRHPDLNPADVAYTLQVGRAAFSHRRVVVCQGPDDAIDALETLDPQRVSTGLQQISDRPVVFMFSGQGAQYVNMGRGLYRTEPIFREQVDRCAELLQPHLGLDLRDLLYPDEGETEQAAQQLRQTALTQPALFTIEYALAGLWMAWGVRPRAMIGHSIGEYVAACLAGVFSLPDALALVAARGRLMDALPSGAMLAVPLPEAEVQPLLGPHLSLAAINGSSSCVISGPSDAVQALHDQLTARDVQCRPLHTSHAFHSAMMDAVLAPFTGQVIKVKLAPPEIPYLSNVTGAWITPEEATDAAYWARHLRHTVRFAQGLGELLQEPAQVLLEVGPGTTLSTLARRHPARASEQAVLSSLRHPQDQRPDEAFVLHTLGRLWLAGVQIDWPGFYAHERRQRLPLPAYPFERQRYWLAPTAQPPAAGRPRTTLNKIPNVAEWFYLPVWERSELPPPPALDDAAGQPANWLVFTDAWGLGASLVERLREDNRDVVTVQAGQKFSQVSDGAYTLDPGKPDDYEALLAELESLNKVPPMVAHFWSVTPNDRAFLGPQSFEEAQTLGFYSLLFLTQALGKQGSMVPLDIGVVSNNVQAVNGQEPLCPEKATVLGPCVTIPQEYPNVTCRSIDVALAGAEALQGEQGEKLVEQLLAELSAPSVDVAVAYRGDERWRQTFQATSLEGESGSGKLLRDGGVYVILGGLGEVGLALAEHLARTARAKLVLTQRSAFPDRDAWGAWLSSHDDGDSVARKIQKLQVLEGMGAQVLVLSADVADPEQMQGVIARTLERFGALHGVIHSAGTARGSSFKPIQDIGQAECEVHFRPKAHGLLALESALQGRKLDFCLLQSSLSSVLGGLGNVAYAAASLFMDAWTHKQNQANGARWISVNWDSWHREEAESGGVGTTLVELSIAPEEGVEALQYVLAPGIPPQVVVSTGDLLARIDQWIQLKSWRGGERAADLQAPVQTIDLPSGGELERRITAVWQSVLGVAHVGVHDNFFDLGGNSLLGLQLVSALKREFNVQINPVTLFEAPTVSALVKYLRPEQKEPQRPRLTGQRTGQSEIAIVGMVGRFPGADDLEAFWRNLRDGVESITFFSDQELRAAGVDAALLEDPNYVKARPILNDVTSFDAAFFGYSPREAELMDPQHRVFLECAWQALEHAGYDSERYPGAIGVYAGVSISTYLLSLYSQTDLVKTVDPLQTVVSNDKDSLTTSVSYKLNLKGPSIAVQTFCSTSLVAVHLACQSLQRGECDMALAGGVSIAVPQTSGYHYREGGILSPDGHCRAFDAGAQGTLFGNGVGVVVLKRLDEALADGDRVYAVLKGSAINNDGSLKVGYTAPSVEGQAQVIAAAQAAAGVAPESISYVEAHGTGTALGDPVEIAALTKAFRAGTEARGFCAIGSVKSNVGHLDRAAGVAALIKAVLALEHGQIPPSLHYERPNPKIDFENSPFYVNTELSEWQSNGGPRRAGVSALGFGGTNAHVIVEQAPPLEPSGAGRPWQLLLLSARTATALEAATANLAAHLQAQSELSLADVAYTLQVGRRGFRHRRAVVCQDLDDALEGLEKQTPPRVLTEEREPRARPVAFLFSGQGAQYVGMGRELYEGEPVFREQVDRCCELLRPHLGLYSEPACEATRSDSRVDEGLDLRELLYPAEGEEEEAREKLGWTALTQPALFVIEYALAGLWMGWGVQPQAMLGHSIGEYVAACLAGVFSLEDALALVAARGRLMGELPAGAMLAVPLAEEDVQALLGPDLSLAAINGPQRCVVSGTTEAVAALEKRLEAQGVACRRLHTSHAFHSALMEPMLEAFRARVEAVTLHPPQRPYLSNVTGRWIEAQEATDPDYWVRHVRQTVRFAEGVGELLREPERVLLEVGPGRTLSSLARQHDRWSAEQTVVTSLRHPQDEGSDLAFLLTALGRLWLAGLEVDWEAFYAHERRRRVPLPTVPFERERCWIEPDVAALSSVHRPVAEGKDPNLAAWFYLPSWKRTLPPGPPDPQAFAVSPRHWLLFLDADGLGTDLAQRLRQLGQEVTLVAAGETFEQSAPEIFVLDPRRREDYGALFAELRAADRLPDVVLHLGSVNGQVATFKVAQELGLYSLLYLAQALGELEQSVQVEVITDHVHSVIFGEAAQPEKAPLLGLCKVLPQEYPHLTCRNIDLPPPTGAPTGAREKLAGQIIAEISAPVTDGIVAYRGSQRWVQTFEPVSLPKDGPAIRPLREKGVYLVTDGLESIGYILAEYLAQTVQARLVIVEGPGFPAREAWQEWLATHDQRDAVRAKIEKISALEAFGAEVLVLSADLIEAGQMRRVLATAADHFGELNGLIHAAGVTGEKSFRAIQETGPTECGWHFEPKVHALYALDQALQEYDRKLDFCLLVSSLACFLGGRGYVAYAASNLFVDAFAQKCNQRYPTPWISVNWDAWQFEGAGLTAVTGDLAQFAMTPSEVGEAFRRIVCTAAADQVVVSTGDLPTRLEKWVKRFDALRDAAQTGGARTVHPRPKLPNPYVAPRTDLERKMVEVWQKTLGFEPIGVQDNFFELGGESFIAIRMISQLKQELNRDVSVVSLYEGSTIEALARIVEQEMAQDSVSLKDQEAKISRRKQYRRMRRSKTKRRQEYLYE